ncbi:hypothetical protein P8A21_04440 [Streptomyces poriferorum]|uniref:hypothetical protein n=1 Tax=Streptomyces poriferorum TaxID=2798799 RepID=UPI001C5CFC60|nr:MULTISPECIES: hypothetical protein [Streptomyces]MBW5247470.1 hypothetical protein [Streptomyces poriferorum]MBW5255475.1 hypothetical protein [Streptomyces poriferorum]WLQ46797.1 hypothetical protein P8A21_04440 [Streptomyces sp. Alt1]
MQKVAKAATDARVVGFCGVRGPDFHRPPADLGQITGPRLPPGSYVRADEAAIGAQVEQEPGPERFDVLRVEFLGRVP